MMLIIFERFYLTIPNFLLMDFTLWVFCLGFLFVGALKVGIEDFFFIYKR